jgi:hypothetical protein
VELQGLFLSARGLAFDGVPDAGEEELPGGAALARGGFPQTAMEVPGNVEAGPDCLLLHSPDGIGWTYLSKVQVLVGSMARNPKRLGDLRIEFFDADFSCRAETSPAFPLGPGAYAHRPLCSCCVRPFLNGAIHSNLCLL